MTFDVTLDTKNKCGLLLIALSVISAGCDQGDDSSDPNPWRVEAETGSSIDSSSDSPSMDARELTGEPDVETSDSSATIDSRDTSDAPEPVFTRLKSGGSFACSAISTGELYCWNPGVAPTPIRMTQGPVDVFGVGGDRVCARVNDSLHCWRWRDEKFQVVDVSLSGPIEQLAVGSAYVCALRKSGEVDCSGQNKHVTTKPPAAEFRKIEGAMNHVCGVTRGGEARCWGHGGVGETNPLGGPFDAVSTGHLTSCGIRPDGDVECWGRGTNPNASESSSDFDQGIPPDKPFETVSMGGLHGCGIPEEGSIECWGFGSDPDRDESTKWAGPDYDQAVPPDGRFERVAAASRFSCALSAEGEIVCWGRKYESGKSFTASSLQ